MGYPYGMWYVVRYEQNNRKNKANTSMKLIQCPHMPIDCLYQASTGHKRCLQYHLHGRKIGFFFKV